MGYILPRVLLLVGIVEVLFRFAPPDWPIYEPGEREVLFRTLGDAFERNLRVHDVSSGDLVRVGNLPDGKEQRSRVFTTDGLGLRNVGITQPIAGVLFGDSFAYDADNDKDTLSAQLGLRIGCSIYNAAGLYQQFQKPNIKKVLSVVESIRFKGRYVLVEQVERLMFESSVDSDPTNSLKKIDILDWATARIPGFRRLVRASDELEMLARGTIALAQYMLKITRRSSLEIIAERAVRSLMNDKVLPNTYADEVVKAKLLNGERILFYRKEIETYERNWPVRIDHWVQLARDLSQFQLKLLVVLVPNKYTVYHRILADAPHVAADPGELLTRTEIALKSKNISVINLTNLLRVDAEKNAASRTYNYYREDTHWNERGIEIAASEINRTFPGLQKACR